MVKKTLDFRPKRSDCPFNGTFIARTELNVVEIDRFCTAVALIRARTDKCTPFAAVLASKDTFLTSPATHVHR